MISRKQYAEYMSDLRDIAHPDCKKCKKHSEILEEARQQNRFIESINIPRPLFEKWKKWREVNKMSITAALEFFLKDFDGLTPMAPRPPACSFCGEQSEDFEESKRHSLRHIFDMVKQSPPTTRVEISIKNEVPGLSIKAQELATVTEP